MDFIAYPIPLLLFLLKFFCFDGIDLAERVVTTLFVLSYLVTFRADIICRSFLCGQYLVASTKRYWLSLS